MSKRKAGVNDIIYELDNDDIEISSEDEVKEPKINRLETQTTEVIEVVECEIKESSEEPIPVDISEPTIEEKSPQESSSNGGKIAPDSSATSDEVISIPASPNSPEIEKEPDEIKIDDAECTKTTIYNEDIVVDSPASNSDLGVVGCENRTPLLTVRFRDKKLASTYKKKLKTFMLRLIKIHEKEPSPELESETDIELDIWPEDLNDDEDFEVKSEDNTQENLFFIDTDPCLNQPIEIPTYKNVSTLISNRKEEEEPAAPVFRRGPKCFNCDGDHQLRDCVLPKNNARIAEKRKNMTTRVGRYHVEDEQKYGHLIPGRISGPLRHALGLKRNELPLHIYRMRILGYPPGWLEEARISHSGITMFDSSGAATLDPEEEEGEVSEPGSRDKFDIKKILDFPGFNVPASSRYVEEGHLLGLPPMSEQDSKITMLQMLAPNAMKAYKRKKLTLFPSAANTSAQEVAEMELDSGDEVAEFPSVPPLPDEAPPPPPPPPVQPPPPPESPPPLPPDTPTIHSNDKEKPEEVCNRNSPSLDDLEEKKKLLLDALVGEDVGSNMSSAGDTNNEMDDSITLEEVEAQLDEALNSKNKDLIEEIADCSIPDIEIDNVSNAQEVTNVSPQIETVTKDNFEKVTSTPESKTGHVKTTLYGTPVMNIASSYVKLPSDDKFAKDICDVINFENLPNSTGKYKKICNVLKRVKSEVDRIQES